MEPETTAKMNELLSYLIDTIKSADGFVREQAPDVAVEILQWGLVCGWIGAVAAAVLIVVAIISFIVAGSCRVGEAGVFFVVVAALCIFVGLTVGICGVRQIILIETAPKLYLIQEIGDMFR